MDTLNVFRLLIIFLKRYDIDARQGHKHESVCHGNFSAKQWTGFYMIRTCVMKELKTKTSVLKHNVKSF